jgi:beta-lactamase regulating signal transducer with metallopeptidase domain
MSTWTQWGGHWMVQDLGWTLLHFLWQGALVAVLFKAALLGLQRRPATERYLAGCVSLLLLVIAPALTFWQFSHSRPAPHVVAVAWTPAGGEPTVSAGANHAKSFAALSPGHGIDPAPASEGMPTVSVPVWNARLFMPWIVSAWLAGLALFSARLCAGGLRVRRLKRVGTQNVEERFQKRLRDLARRLRVSRPVQLLESSLVEVPTVLGWTRQVILLPASCLTGLTPAQWEAVLAHEMAHIKRQDCLVNLLQSFLEAVLFYHPAVWWISGQVRIERENCCDDLVVATCGNRFEYARALVALEEMRPPAATLALAVRGGDLKQRVVRLIAPSAPKGRLERARWCGTALNLLVVGVALVFLGWQWPLAAKAGGSPETLQTKVAAAVAPLGETKNTPADPKPEPSASPRDILQLSIQHADVELVDAEGTNVAVEVFQVAEGKAQRVEVGENDYALWRTEDGLGLRISAPGQNGRVHRVHVPKRMALSIRTEGGRFTLLEHLGNVKLTTSITQVKLGRIQGEVEVRLSGGGPLLFLESVGGSARILTSGAGMVVGDINGPAALESSGGGIKAGRVSGRLCAKSSGGGLTVGLAGDTVQIESSGGSVAVNLSHQFKEESAIKTSGGSITAGISPRLNLRVAARGEGKTETDLPIEWKDEQDGFRRGVLNEVGSGLVLKAEGGKVVLPSFNEKAGPEMEPVKVRSAIVEVAGPAGSKPFVLFPKDGPGPFGHADRTGQPGLDLAGTVKAGADSLWSGADWRPGKMLAKGLLLRDGAWIEAEVVGLDEAQVKYRKADGKEENVATGKVTAVVFNRIPENKKEVLQANRRGVLLRRGDFFEGEFKGMERDFLLMGSVLFGTKKFNLKDEVGALVLGGQ